MRAGDGGRRRLRGRGDFPSEDVVRFREGLARVHEELEQIEVLGAAMRVDRDHPAALFGEDGFDRRLFFFPIGLEQDVSFRSTLDRGDDETLNDVVPPWDRQVDGNLRAGRDHDRRRFMG